MQNQLQANRTHHSNFTTKFFTTLVKLERPNKYELARLLARHQAVTGKTEQGKSNTGPGAVQNYPDT